MKKITVLTMAAILSSTSFAMKLGYVNTNELFSKYSQVQKLREELGKQKTKLEKELKEEELELQKLQLELKGKGDLITNEEKKAFEDKVNKFQEKIQSSQKKISETEIKEMQGIERLMNISIQNVAKTGKYDYILEQAAIKFGGEDVTDKVLEVMEKSKKRN